MQTYRIEINEVAKHHLAITYDPTRVTVDGGPTKVEIISDGAADVWYTLDGTVPQVHGSRSYYMPAGGLAIDERGGRRQPPAIITLISDGTAVVSVQRGQ